MIKVTVTSQVVYHMDGPSLPGAAAMALEWKASGARPAYTIADQADAEWVEEEKAA